MKILFLLPFVFLIGCANDSALNSFESASIAGTDEEPAGPHEPLGELEVLHEQAPVLGAPFSASREVFKLANGPAQQWDGCDQDSVVSGGYDSDSKCGKGYFHPAFVEHLNENFFPCVQQASFAANLLRPSRVFIRHLGTYVDRTGRGSSALSMHAYARAIDLAKLNLFDDQGRLISISLKKADYKGATAKFYDTFRQCWKDSMPSQCQPGKRESGGSIGHPNSALGGNSLHTGHIHLSFPFCAG